MACAANDDTIRSFWSNICERLDKTATTAKAAEACALAGNLEQALNIGLDVEQPLYKGHDFPECCEPDEPTSRS
jgi:hypothetical protein